MSWGPVTAVDTSDAIEGALEAAAEAYKSNLAAQDYVLDDAANEAIAAGIAAAVSCVSAVAPGQEVSVTLGGHANPGHVPVSGWSNDFLQITISNSAKPEVPAAA